MENFVENFYQSQRHGITRPLILYIAMSLDGYIAKQDDNIDFLAMVDRPGEDYGYADFHQQVDTVIMGRKTYDKVLSFGIDFPHREKKCFVLSKSKTGQDAHVTFYNGDLRKLIETLKQQEGKNIYCDGGAEVVYELLKEGLVDKIVVSIIPHLLGEGIRLFKDGLPEQKMKLTRSMTFPSGLVQIWYDRI